MNRPSELYYRHTISGSFYYAHFKAVSVPRSLPVMVYQKLEYDQNWGAWPNGPVLVMGVETFNAEFVPVLMWDVEEALEPK